MPTKRKTKLPKKGSKKAQYSVALVVFGTDEWTANVVAERIRALIQASEGLSAARAEFVLNQETR